MPAPGHSAIAIDTSQIPEHGVEEWYQRWKAEKDKKAAEAAAK